MQRIKSLTAVMPRRSEGKFVTPLSREIQATVSAVRSFLNPNTTYALAFSYYLGFGSSVGGSIVNTVTDITGLGSAYHYSSAANVFDEVLLEGVRVDILPRNRYSKTTTSSTALFMVHDDDSTPTLGGYDEAASYESACAKMNIDDGTYGSDNHSKPVWFPRPRSHTYLSQWQTSAPGGLTMTGATAFYATNLSSSIAYFDAIFTYVVKMRLIVGN